jgi:hypothetical protein
VCVGRLVRTHTGTYARKSDRQTGHISGRVTWLTMHVTYFPSMHTRRFLRVGLRPKRVAEAIEAVEAKKLAVRH